MIHAVTALRRYRDEVNAKPSAAVRGHLVADGHEGLRDQMARLARFEWVDGADADGDVVASIPVPGGAVQVLPSDAFDAGEAQARIEKKRADLSKEIERAEQKLANDQFVSKAPAAVVDEERAQAGGVPRGAGPARVMNFRQAEEYLLSLELFGMRFGLDRMHRLMTVLGLPQRRFASIHVVGSNGKSSTVRMSAPRSWSAEGLRTGSYTSPHLRSFRERIEVGEEPVSEADFAAAVTRAAQAAELVNRTSEPDDHVTQFEALTAASYHELARRGVEVAVIEAGLGGRFDATNVIPSKVQVLTSVEPGTHPLARPDPGGHRPGEAGCCARPRDAGGGRAAARGARHRSAGGRGAAREACDGGRGGARGAGQRAPRAEDLPLRAAGAFQRGNFSLAAAGAEAFLGRPLRGACIEGRCSETVVPGRLQAVGERPLTLFDGAHNPSGATALAASLPEVFGSRRPRVAVVGVLEDKDAAGMLETLLPHLDRVVFTRPRNPRSLSPATLVSLAEKLGAPPLEIVAEPQAALERARELAGEDGVVLATGSIYLVADLVREAADARASTL